MNSGISIAAKPVGAWRAFPRDPGVADKARPMGEPIGSRHETRGQIFSQRNPRLLFRRVFPGDLGDVQQHRFAPFLNREPAEASGIDAR